MKMQMQEKSSKYSTRESKKQPISPKASLAISGNELVGLCMRASGTEPGCSGDFQGESSKYAAGLGSPFNSLPIITDVFHVMNEKLSIANMPPTMPALANAYGRPSNPTP
jgi:hypothetical protein